MTPKIHIKKDMVASTFNSRTSEVDINRCGEAFFEKMCQPHSCSGVVNQYKTDSVCVFVYVCILCLCCFAFLSHRICLCFHPKKTFTLLLFITSSSVCSGVHIRFLPVSVY